MLCFDLIEKGMCLLLVYFRRCSMQLENEKRGKLLMLEAHTSAVARTGGGGALR